ncbi:hypothetical protein SEVIR_4G014100v4 [Setaria viridis]|uniref:FLZ-type domain-containing protein n=2 Tax=Setaria TaxID=4554 RepID=K3Y015_SETIT|nr:uncharacterized protein LOC101780407 [Setaria italica]XP_034592039.1 FCS-Like Zinc finger 2-like [Setaria viridis]RCV19907.1 hypothetical protein SETIT_4G013900v2 [Setaria italica]TKW19340.1 hypothetical protein SEVIR_4G014100v2 [Setaria viridis]
MEARYVKVASRYFIVGNGNAGDGCGGGGDHRRRHFLDACFLCKRDITPGRHIFMYKGDAAFCSDECRQDQRAMDAALKAARRRQRYLQRSASLPVPSSAAAAAMPRRPTVAGLAAHAPVLSG